MNTSLRPIKKEDIQSLVEMAKADGHDLWNPTHIIDKDGEMLGAVSIDGIPMCTVFLSSEVNSSLVARQVGKEMDRIITSFGDKNYFVAVGPQSAVHKFMPLGDYMAYDTTLWYKDLA